MTALSVIGLSKRFGKLEALREMDLSVSRGEFFCVLGQTNAGKSTLLKTIAGIYRPDRGQIVINGEDVTRLAPRHRNVSLLFQSVALFPDRTGFENIALPLKRAGFSENNVKRRVHEVAELLRISHVLQRLPGTYSGGERQRTAIGRAIAVRSDLLLLDEPLSNLDARIRLDLRIELRRLHRVLGQTVVYVTHDQSEALSLADRIALISKGQLIAVDKPEALYEQPPHCTAAELVGSPHINLLPVYVDCFRSQATLTGNGFFLDAPAELGPQENGKKLLLGVRPERVHIDVEQTERSRFAGRVLWIEYQGRRSILHAELGGISLCATVDSDFVHPPGSPVWIGFASDKINVFQPVT